MKKESKYFYIVCGLIILYNIILGLIIIFKPFEIKTDKKQKDKVEINEKEEIKVPEEPKEEIDTYVDTNPIINGLYNKNDSSRYLVKDINSKFILNQDIVVLSTFLTNESNISNGYIKDVFYNYYNAYTNIENYKIGYTISFMVGDTKYYKQILNIEDSKELYDFVQIYLYDDLKPERNEFYTHLEIINEDTLITTIKLTGSKKTDQIVGPINLGVFTYLETDFDENGLYKGKSLYEITINNI